MFYPDNVDVFPLGFDNVRAEQQNDQIILALLQQGVYDNLIRARRQAVIDDNLRHVNRCRHFKDYQPGDQVLIEVYDPSTLQERATDPYPIAQVHVNGTVTSERANQVFERINIGRIRPYLKKQSEGT